MCWVLCEHFRALLSYPHSQQPFNRWGSESWRTGWLASSVRWAAQRGMRTWPSNCHALLKEAGDRAGHTLCGGPHVGFLAPQTLVWQLQLKIHLMSPGTSVPQGTGPDTGNTKRPLEFCTLSFRNMDTWGNKYTCHFSWYVFLDTSTLRKGSI